METGVFPKQNPEHKIELIVCACLALILMIRLSAATDISTCSIINASGSYTLTQSLTAPIGLVCLDVKARDVTLDCLGKNIEGSDTLDSVGIYSNKDNLTVRNCSIINWHTGIKKEGSNNGLIEKSNLISNSKAISLANSEGNKISDSVIKDNSQGIALSFSENNLIYNNLFNNTQNAIFTGSNSNIWNAARQKGKRIYSSGGYIGGNYWSSLQGGLSENCNDSNKDGFCDEPYVLDSKNIDNLPLSTKYTVDTVPPQVSIVSPSSDSILDTKNITVTITADDAVYGYTNVSVTQGDSIINSTTTTQKGTFSVSIQVNRGGYYNITATTYDLEDNSRSATVTNVLTPLEITSCSELTKSGEIYVVDSPIAYSSGSICINVQADNIIFDCQNKAITGRENVGYKIYGIALNGRSNVTIRNCTLSGWDYGIFSQSSTKLTVQRCNLLRNRNAGIYLYSSLNNAIFENVIANNSIVGLTLESSGDNRIYNNVFDNKQNVAFKGDRLKNYWNTTRKEGTRTKTRGNEIGGNYWSGATGYYSESCEDEEADGFCDEPYDVEEYGEPPTGSFAKITGFFINLLQLFSSQSSNTDYLPLSTKFTPDTTPPVTNASILLPNGTLQDVSQWIKEDNAKIILNCSDGHGSGCKKTVYCIEKTQNCTPTKNFHEYIPLLFDKNLTETYYLNYYSIDVDDNNEPVKNLTIKSPSTNKLATIVSPLDLASFNKTDINVTVSVLKPSECNYTEILVYNTSGNKINQTNYTSNGTFTANFSFPGEGTYTIELIFHSTYNYYRTESRSTIIIDKTPPQIIFTLSPSTVELGGKIDASCTATDNAKGTFKGEITPEITTLIKGKRSATCTARDDAGNVNSSTREYEVTETQCNEGSRRCSGGNLESCTGNEWVVEKCEYTCDSKTLKCTTKAQEEEIKTNKTENQTKPERGSELSPIIMAAGAFLVLLVIIVMIVLYVKVFNKPKEDYSRRMAILEAKINEANSKGKDVSKLKAEFELAQQDIDMGLVEMARPRISNVEKELKKLK